MQDSKFTDTGNPGIREPQVADELYWRNQPEWKIRAEMEARIDRYFERPPPDADQGFLTKERPDGSTRRSMSAPHGSRL
jgi:hypothetical protein